MSILTTLSWRCSKVALFPSRAAPARGSMHSNQALFIHLRTFRVGTTLVHKPKQDCKHTGKQVLAVGCWSPVFSIPGKVCTKKERSLWRSNIESARFGYPAHGSKEYGACTKVVSMSAHVHPGRRRGRGEQKKARTALMGRREELRVHVEHRPGTPGSDLQV